MKKLFIIGSCATRDAFDPQFRKGEFSIVRYQARTSLTRLNYITYDLKESDINLKSKFQRRILTGAINGDLHSCIVNTEFDYLIIDCVDDRFGSVKFNDQDFYVTISTELNASKLITSEKKVKISPDSVEYQDSWERGLLKILEYVPAEKIIINNVQWASITDEGKTLSSPERILFCTKVVNGFYEIARKYIPESNFINYDGSIFVGAENHKWNRAPFHYVDDVYHYFIKRLNEITN